MLGFAGCKKDEPAEPAATEVSAEAEVPVVPEVAETAAEKKAKADAAKKNKETDAIMAKLKETMEADTDEATKEAEAKRLLEVLREMEKTVPEQTKCPVMGGDIDKNIFVTYKDKKVYFCCKACVAKFEADPSAYVGKLPQFQK